MTMKKLLILLVLLTLSCKKQKIEESYLGIVNIEVTGNKEAVAHFEKGLLLLHSFEYYDSRESFRKASEADPNMAMAYWGEAMTHNHSLWHGQNFDQGMAAVQKLKARPGFRGILAPARLLEERENHQLVPDRFHFLILWRLHCASQE